MTIAVIVAAGLGARLGARSRARHKALLPIGETTLIERSIALLRSVGVPRVVIGVGHRRQDFLRLLQGDGSVILHDCPDYATTSSLATLYRLRTRIDQDFLLLEADLLYERRALDLIMASQHKDVVLTSSVTTIGDEVYVEADARDRLIAVSKDRRRLGQIAGVWVGISRLSAPTFRALLPSMADRLARAPKTHYEELLAAVRPSLPILHAPGLRWTEVDNQHHLRFARNTIYPDILRTEALA